jgi:hypothetical protein
MIFGKKDGKTGYPFLNSNSHPIEAHKFYGWIILIRKLHISSTKHVLSEDRCQKNKTLRIIGKENQMYDQNDPRASGKNLPIFFSSAR